MKLIFTKEDILETKMLWQLIDKGWSVVSTIFDTKRQQFRIKLDEESWPAITVTCSGCGTKWPARELSFDPSPGGLCYCSTCK